MNYYSRRIRESPLYQGADERLAYTLTTTPWVSAPTSPVLTIKDSDGVDVTATYSTGSTTASGDVITLARIISLVAGAKYRMEVKWTVGSNVYKAWADLYGQT